MDNRNYTPRFGEIAINKGFISLFELKYALAEQLTDNINCRTHRLLGAILLDKGWIRQSEIDLVIAQLPCQACLIEVKTQPHAMSIPLVNAAAQQQSTNEVCPKFCIRSPVDHLICELQEQVLQALGAGESLQQILSRIALMVEGFWKGTFCSILYVDQSGKRLLLGAGPSLPDYYNQALHGLSIGHGVASCGTAAFQQQRVVVNNIESHHDWSAVHQLATKVGLHSCLSEPIYNDDPRVLGTLDIYNRTLSGISKTEMEVLTAFARLAGIVISCKDPEGRLAEINLLSQKDNEPTLGKAI